MRKWPIWLPCFIRRLNHRWKQPLRPQLSQPQSKKEALRNQGFFIIGTYRRPVLE